VTINDQITALEAEASRILEAAETAGLKLRLTGSVAIHSRCPIHGGFARQGRDLGDIDMAAYKREAARIRQVLAELGYAEDKEVFILSEGARAIFERPQGGLHIDIFFDRLDFCHVIALDGRLDIEPRTLPLADLLLSKLQIVQINEKDLLDAIVLLLEHPLAESDADAINLPRIVALLREDWGLWRTVTRNLDKVRGIAHSIDRLDAEQKRHVAEQIDTILDRAEAAPKSLGWKMRAKIGDRVKWYKDVEEVR
jgi:hypothetical protein